MEPTELKVGKFKVLRRVGRGGMGSVYEGHDPALDRRVAIKTLTTEAIADKESRSRFEREARAAAKLQHPNIVTIYELGNFGGHEKPYIVMEFLEGDDLTSLISRENTLPFAEALEITIQLCRALDFAHQKRVVHRDVKPSNIRCLDDGTVKIMDFGIARVEGSAQITKSGVMVGTIHYMSPEQVKGEKVDGRSDIFSTGCILFEMLAGKRPFQAESPTSVLYKIVNEPTPPLLKDHPELPQEIQEILGKALAKQAGERFRTAGEMAQELEKLLAVYRKTLRRPSVEVQSKLEELEAMRREGRWADIVPLAETMVVEQPTLGTPHKLLRTALREVRQEETERQMTSDEKTRHLAEISREFEILYGPTTVAAGTDLPTTKLAPSPEEERPATISDTRANPLVWPLTLATLASLIGVLGWFILPGGPREVSHTLRVFSDPPGAAIFVNGEDTGHVTNEEGVADIPIEGHQNDEISMELRREGFSSAKAKVVLGIEPPLPLDVTLELITGTLSIVTEPAGASVHLDGVEVAGVTPLELEVSRHEEHEVIIDKAGFVRRTMKISPGQDLPSDVIVLSREGKPGTLLVKSLYPVAILRGGRTLAAQSGSPAVKLMAGRSEVTLYAPEFFLNRAITVDIREEATTTISTPALGKFSVRAFPGNCTLTIDGITSETPPFDNKPIVVGQHTFQFEWPGGAKKVYTEDVALGETTYVTGRSR